MSDGTIHFRGQMPGEEILSFARKHWVSLLPNIIPYALYLSGVVVFLLIIGQFQLPSINDPLFQLFVILAFIVTGFMTHRFFLRMINHFLNVMIVTNYRIVEISRTLFVNNIKESIDMKKIQDIQYQQHGVFKNLLKFGELHIVLGNSETKVITQIPNPDFFFRLINRIKADYFVEGSEAQPSQKFQRGHNTLERPTVTQSTEAGRPVV